MTPLDHAYREHEVESQPSDASNRITHSPVGGRRYVEALHALTIAGREASQLHRSELATSVDQLASIWQAMEAGSPYVMALTLWELGWLRERDQCLTAADIAACTCAPAKYRPLMSQWLTTLEEAGFVHRAPGSTERYITRCVDIALIRDRVDQAVAAVDLGTHYPGFIEYFRTCVAHQSGLLTGTVNPHKLLFPAGTSRLVDGLYRLNPASTIQNEVVAAIVATACRTFHHDLRILEVGAGTGATTAAVLAAASPLNLEYEYTDISRFFLRRAARQFGTSAPCLAYGVLDLDQSPESQGYESHSFDVIIGVNALHTAKHIGRSLNHLASLMSNRGVLIANETTTNTALQMITFGHFEGVCHFEDERRRSNLPFLSRGQWESTLRSCGFGFVEAIPGPYEGAGAWEQHVLLAARLDGDHA